MDSGQCGCLYLHVGFAATNIKKATLKRVAFFIVMGWQTLKRLFAFFGLVDHLRFTISPSLRRGLGTGRDHGEDLLVTIG